MKLERDGLFAELRAFVKTGDGVLVGAPGVGKTVLLKTYCRALLDEGTPCLYLPIDKLGANSEADLRTELGLQTDVATYLRSQERPTDHPPVLVIDAFDAARSELAQRFVLGLIRRLKDALGGRWRIIVSVRVYDGKKSAALQQLFPATGQRPTSALQESEITCRHFLVPPLSDEDVARVVESIPELARIYRDTIAEFRALMRIPFNLWLVERLLASPDSHAQLTTVHSEIQLLNLFWSHRVLQAPNPTDATVLLTKMTAQMVNSRTLAPRIEDAYPMGGSQIWEYLLSSEILEIAKERTQRVAFSHNILFDYAVSVLLIEDDPAAACGFLAEDPSRPLFLRPSVDYFFTRLWHTKPQTFWDVLWYMLQAPETHVRVYARLVPAVTMAREARNVEQFRPLFTGLEAGDPAAPPALLHLLQAVRGLFKGQRDSLWASLLDRAVISLHADFAWELATLAHDILERAITSRDESTIAACARVGRALMQWVWAERSSKATAFLDNVGGIWGVRLVSRTFGTDLASARGLLDPILQKLSEPEFPITYFATLTDEVPHVWGTDPDFGIAIYAAAFSHEERSETKTSFGTPILPLTSTRRQDFSMCQYHLSRHFRGFLEANVVAAARAAIRGLNDHIIHRHLVPFLNPGFSLADVTETFAFRGRTAFYIQDLSYSWGATRVDEPIELADQLFHKIEALAAANQVASIDPVLDVFAEEVRAAFFWSRLLETGSKVPRVFAARLFELALAQPVLEHPETLQSLGQFLEEASTHFDNAQRTLLERKILDISERATDDKQAESRAQRRNRLISRLPRELLATDEVKQVRQELEERDEVSDNRPLVSFRTWSEGYSEDKWLRERGADPTRQSNKALLDATAPLEQFSSMWRNSRPNAEAIESIVVALGTAYQAVSAPTDADTSVRDIAWTRTASAAETVARGIENAEHDAFTLAKRILLGAVVVDAGTDDPKRDETYTSASWSPTPATEAAQGLPWLARLRADDDVLRTIETLARDPRPWIRFLIVRELFRIIETAPETLWRLADDRAQHERNVVVQDALIRALGDLLPSAENRVTPLLSTLAERIAATDQDSDALKSLTAIAMWLAFTKENAWAITYTNQMLERPDEFSHRLTYAVFEAMQYVAPNRIDTSREVWSTRAISWLTRALNAAGRGMKSIAAVAGSTWDERTTEIAKRLYGVSHEIVMRLHFAIDEKFDSSRRGGGTPSDVQRAQFYVAVKPLLEQILALAKDPAHGVLFAPTAHHFMELLQEVVDYDVGGVLHLASEVASSAERGGYHLDSMAASEVVAVAERVLADYRSELRAPNVLADLVKLLDLFAKVGWPDALRLLWRLDEVFR